MQESVLLFVLVVICFCLFLSTGGLEPILNKHKLRVWASLVAQWLRVCLPMQGTRVRALVWEGPTCCGATGPVSQNY